MYCAYIDQGNSVEVRDDTFKDVMEGKVERRVSLGEPFGVCAAERASGEACN